jgi:hypothetical protein
MFLTLKTPVVTPKQPFLPLLIPGEGGGNAEEKKLQRMQLALMCCVEVFVQDKRVPTVLITEGEIRDVA